MQTADVVAAAVTVIIMVVFYKPILALCQAVAEVIMFILVNPITWAIGLSLVIGWALGLI